MASTMTSSGTTVDRKTLKRPDRFLSAISGVFKDLTDHFRLFIVAIAGLFVVGLLVAFYMNHRHARAESGWNALFLAEKQMDEELKKLLPAAPKKDTDKPVPGAEEAAAFKKLDVDAQFPESVKKLSAVEQEFGGTRAAYEAQMKLGNLYFNHGEFSKAVPWFKKATDSAPANLEKALAFSSIGYSHENLSKPTEAIEAFQKALNQGEGSLKGDLLMGMARNYEAAHDLTKARSTYDQIMVDLPNTEFSKSAEIYRNQIKQ